MDNSALLITDDPEQSMSWAQVMRQSEIEVETIRFKNEDWEALQDKSYDLFVMLTRGRNGEGIKLCKQIKPEIINPILYLSPSREEDYILQAYQAGVDEYIPLPIDPQLFAAKLRAWLRRAWTVEADALDPVQAGKLQLDPAQRHITLADGRCIRLTNLEFRVLYLLMTHRGKSLESKYITQHVWGYVSSEDSVLLKNVIYRLRKKIESDPAAPANIKTVPGLGYSWDSNGA